MSRRGCLCAVIVLALAAAAAAGPLEKARQEAEEAKVEPVFVRMYNVQDLMLGRDHPYDGLGLATELGYGSVQCAAQAAGGGGGFGDLFAGERLGEEAALTSALSPEVLREIIMRTVKTEPWEDMGGRARIENVGALLVITQTAEGHRQINALIDQFRRARRMVTIQARWLLARPDELQPLLLNAPRSVPQVVDLAPLARPEVALSFVYHAHITCFDRQMVHLTSGPAASYVLDVEPVVAERAAGWDPTTSTVLFGAFLQVTPSVSADGREATVDVQSTITEKDRGAPSATLESSSGEATAKGEIDKPGFLAHTFRTTLRVPLDQPVLVGGMTSPEALEGKVIYLVLEVSASEGLPEAAPAAPEGKKTK
ncbi:MAG: hypothetical protein R6X20_09180 [Phycisphaerae bacterium]